MAKPPSAASSKAEDIAIECGIIMPIAEMTGYTESHWVAMRELISRGVRKAGMTPQPVWANGPADVLQERIVRNLYEQPFAVCDVSGLNPNVMLELGIRLAFGKPTIIVNDGVSRAPFDIGPAEYVAYDRSLHYQTAEDFVSRLAARIDAVKAVVDQNSYRPYIKTFGPIELGTPGSEAVSLGQAVLDQIAGLASEMRVIKSRLPHQGQETLSGASRPLFKIGGATRVFNYKVDNGNLSAVKLKIKSAFPDAKVMERGDGTISVALPGVSSLTSSALDQAIQNMVENTDDVSLFD